MIYNITQARKQFEKLVDLALAGEEVILAGRNAPVARLEPIRMTRAPRRMSAKVRKHAHKKPKR
jgi:prevent-host-death family protein